MLVHHNATIVPPPALTPNMRAGLFVLLCACDAGERRTPPEPVPKPVPVPVVPADAAIVSVDASTVPTPPNRDLRIDVRVKSESPEAECARNTLRLRLLDKAKAVVDQFEDTSTCSGACTAADKREGEATVRAIERRIEKDESSTSELDYNFTSCLETGYGEQRKFRNVGGRDVVVFTDRYLGPHDGEYHRLRIATEVCGKLFVSEGFGEHMAHSWDIDHVRPIAEGDGALSIYGEHYQKGTLLRLHLPACPGMPREEAFDVHPIYKL
jgi:hypothetical protein